MEKSNGEISISTIVEIERNLREFLGEMIIEKRPVEPTKDLKGSVLYTRSFKCRPDTIMTKSRELIKGLLKEISVFKDPVIIIREPTILDYSVDDEGDINISVSMAIDNKPPKGLEKIDIEPVVHIVKIKSGYDMVEPRLHHVSIEADDKGVVDPKWLIHTLLPRLDVNGITYMKNIDLSRMMANLVPITDIQPGKIKDIFYDYHNRPNIPGKTMEMEKKPMITGEDPYGIKKISNLKMKITIDESEKFRHHFIQWIEDRETTKEDVINRFIYIMNIKEVNASYEDEDWEKVSGHNQIIIPFKDKILMEPDKEYFIEMNIDNNMIKSIVYQKVGESETFDMSRFRNDEDDPDKMIQTAGHHVLTEGNNSPIDAADYPVSQIDIDLYLYYKVKEGMEISEVEKSIQEAIADGSFDETIEELKTRAKGELEKAFNIEIEKTKVDKNDPGKDRTDN